MSNDLTVATDAAAPVAVPVRRSIPSLDGLRALSIALVIFSHLGNAGVIPARLAALTNTFVAPGGLGVRVFFISGFLITTLLLNEVRAEGTVDLARFYLRRTMRIFPPYYVYVGVVWILAARRVITTAPGDYLHALTYTVDTVAGSAGPPSHSVYVGHAWSLSIEEQFYVLWPATLVVLGARRAWRTAAAIVLFGPLVKLTLFLATPPAGHHTVFYSFFGVIDFLAAGCVLAALRPAMHRAPQYQRVLGAPWFWLATPLAVLCWSAAGRWRFGVLTQTASLIFLALGVDRAMTYPGSHVGRFLNWAPLAWVGRLSYSLYLWQQLFTLREPQDVVLKNTGLMNAPWRLLAILVCAVVSYYGIEQPSLRLRVVLERQLPRSRRPLLKSQGVVAQ